MPGFVDSCEIKFNGVSCLKDKFDILVNTMIHFLGD